MWKCKRFPQISKRTAAGFLSRWAWSPASLPGMLDEMSGISSSLWQSWASEYLSIRVPEHPGSHPVKPSPLCSRKGGNCNWGENFRTNYFRYVNTNHAWILLSMKNFQGDSISKLRWKGFSFFLESATKYNFWLLTRPCKS